VTARTAAHPAFARGLAAAFAAMLIWGAQLPIAKGAFVAVDGFSMTVVRYGVASVSFVLLLLWREGRDAFTYHGHGRQALLGGAFGLGASALLLFVGLSLTRPEVAVIILALQPAMAALGEWIVEGRPPPKFTLVCIAIAFVGVALVVTRGAGFAAFGGPGSGAASELLGNLLTVLASIAWVGYAMVTARMSGWTPLRVSALTSVPAFAVIVLAWFVADALGGVRIDVQALPAASWRLAYVSLVGVVLAMFLWNLGVQRTGAVNAMLLLKLMPVVTFAIRAAEGAHFEPVELAGAAIVVGALVTNSLLLRRGAAAG
jgi:drug/metabolite transporter (DMT)-like permease